MRCVPLRYNRGSCGKTVLSTRRFALLRSQRPPLSQPPTVTAHQHRHSSPLGLDRPRVVRVRLVLWRERIVVGHRPEEHLCDPHPVGRARRGHERLEIVAADESGRPVLKPAGEALEQADGDVSMEEGEPLEEELAHARDAEVVRPPVLEAKLRGGGGGWDMGRA